MKTQTTGLFTAIGQAQMVSLTTEVKETLARVTNYSATKKFTAADFWNIQRNKRSRVQRRFAL